MNFVIPKVTIIMATYNRASFIVETLASVRNQVFTDWECLIIDDGGTDDTAAVIAPLLEQDKRFQFLKRPDIYLKGLPGCRNYGLDLSKGEYIIFFDDDDIVHPQNLELCVYELMKDDISFCRYIREVFYDTFDYTFDFSKVYESFYIDVNDIERILRNELPFNSCAVMWKKKCFANHKFAEHLMYAEEWELYSRIISSGFRGISIDKCLFFGRKHLHSNTGEFYSRSPIRRASYADAILLVVIKLKEQHLLSHSIIRYFIVMSRGYKEYNLFDQLLKEIEVTGFDYFKWQLFFFVLPLRAKITKLKKRIIKK